MYIRQTTTRCKKDESSYQTYRLVESTRVGEKAKQRTLLNLRREFFVPREKWQELTSRIDETLTHQQGLSPLEGRYEAEAQRIAAKIIERKKEYSPAEEIQNSFESVDINSIEHSNLRSVGTESIALDAFKSLQLDQKLSALGFNESEVAAATGTIIGRMCVPSSELATHKWLQNESGLGDLLGHDFNQCSLSRMYRVSDKLLHHQDALETHLFKRERSLFDLDCSITLYDLTNTFFEGTAEQNDKAERGHSKEKCTDCPLVTLGLVLDFSGFPRRSKIFNGNVSEGVTLQDMVSALADDKSNPIIVMDAGIATEKNIQWLKEKGFRYLVVSRKRYREWEQGNRI